MIPPFGSCIRDPEAGIHPPGPPGPGAFGDAGRRLVRGDITQTDADAFVYDITEDCKLGSGYGTAIMLRGGKVIQDELTKIGRCKTGEAVVTGAGELQASYIIHVNGPKFHEPDTAKKLESAVRSALQRAKENGIKRVAFPPSAPACTKSPSTSARR